MFELVGRGVTAQGSAPMAGGSELRAQKKLLQGYKKASTGDYQMSIIASYNLWASLQITGLDLSISSEATIVCRLASDGGERVLAFELDVDEDEGIVEYSPAGELSRCLSTTLTRLLFIQLIPGSTL